MVHAFGYLRVSGLAQCDGDGFERQRTAIEKHAADAGIVIDRWFEERGVTGKSDWQERPAFALMMAELGRGVETVMIERLDRLARDLMVSETILADMRKRGFTLISALEPDLCSSDPSRVLMRQIFAAIAQYDRCMIVAKMRAAKDRIRARDGRCEGQKPFGELDGEQRGLRLMKALRAEGTSFEAIAVHLNECGISSRSGRPWRASSVCQILSR
jgi:DNA invertase Pin-like site-specific DNA recombinase